MSSPSPAWLLVCPDGEAAGDVTGRQRQMVAQAQDDFLINEAT